MKYTPQQYAESFFELLRDHPEKKYEIAQALFVLMRENGDITNAEKIVEAVEKGLTKEEGKKNVDIHSARPLSKKMKQSLELAFGSDAVVRYDIRPDIIAGVRITIDNDMLLDATLKTKLQTLCRTK